MKSRSSHEHCVLQFNLLATPLVFGKLAKIIFSPFRNVSCENRVGRAGGREEGSFDNFPRPAIGTTFASQNTIKIISTAQAMSAASFSFKLVTMTSCGKIENKRNPWETWISKIC